MTMNLVGIAGVPAQDMSGKLVGVGCPCAGTGVGQVDTGEPAGASRLLVLGLMGAALVGLWWMETRRW